MTELTDFQKSALSEMGNIGAGHAAIALSQLIGKKIMIAVTKVRLAGIADFIKDIGNKEALVVGVYLKVLGEAQGGIILVFLRESALSLVDILLNQKIGTTKILAELEESALKETGSILSGAYLNALSELMQITLIPSVPKIAFDQAGVVVESIFGHLLNGSNIVLGIETEFVEAATRIKGHFLFMPDAEGIKMMLKKLGVATV
jgi:chemotaxis protein CheC